MNGIFKLLPYHPNMTIKNIDDALKVLTLLKKLIIFSQEAADHFIEGNYHLFDALVGENLCQIRAYKTYLLALGYYDNLNTTSLLIKKNQLMEVQILLDKSINLILNLKSKKTKEIIYFLNKDKTLADIIDSNQLCIILSDQELYLIKIYLLSRYTIINDFGIHTGIDYFKMCSEMSCSKTFCRKLIHEYQTEISQYCCDFMFKISEDIAPAKIITLTLKKLLKKDDDGRNVLPCYLVTKILLLHLKKNRHSFIINRNLYYENIFLREEIILFHLPQNIRHYHGVDIVKNLHNKFVPYIIFRGITISDNKNRKSNFLNEINKISIEKIILANMALHPQYAGKKLANHKENPYKDLLQGPLPSNIRRYIVRLENELIKMKKLTKELGCCQENPSLFFSTHIFLEKINYLLEEKPKQNELIILFAST